MRISDWSSDVCSSDLGIAGQLVARIAHAQAKTVFLHRQAGAEAHVPALVALGHGRQPRAAPEFAVQQVRRAGHVLEQAADRAGAVQRTLRAPQHSDRSKERRVWEGCVSTCSTRGAPMQKKKK